MTRKQFILTLDVIKALLAVVLLISALACRNEDSPCPTCPPPPPPYVQSIFLDTLSVGVTDVVLRLWTTDTAAASTVQLYRDTALIFTHQAIRLDTMLVDTGLLPAGQYNYRAYRRTDSQTADSTTLLTLQTLDTTTHNFTWETFTFGVESSFLKDVAVIDENNIWAVGQVFVRGPVQDTLYNAVHWDGTQWRLTRITFRLDYGDPDPIITDQIPIFSVLAASPDDIWFVSSVGGVTRFRNNSWVMMNFALVNGPGGANRIWGSSSSDMYFVAPNGRITRYHGTSWQRMESGTTVDLLDVWGTSDSSVWACGYTSDYSQTVLLRYDGTSWQKLYEGTPNTPPGSRYTGLLGSLWGIGRDSIYIVNGAQVYRHSQTDMTGVRLVPVFFGDFTFAVRGSQRNNVVVAGEHGMLWHFNGVTWKRYREIRNTSDQFRSITSKDNTVVAVGLRYLDGVRVYGLVVHGKR